MDPEEAQQVMLSAEHSDVNIVARTKSGNLPIMLPSTYSQKTRLPFVLPDDSMIMEILERKMQREEERG